MTATAILDLERAGFSREQVEALARLIEAQTATKADLTAATNELKADLAAVKAELRLLEQRMTIKLGGMIAAAVVLIGAFVRLF